MLASIASQEMKLRYFTTTFLCQNWHLLEPATLLNACDGCRGQRFPQHWRNLCQHVEMDVPIKEEVHQAWLALADNTTNPHPPGVQSHYVLLHLFLWQASASEPHELSESLPEDEEEEGFDML